MKSALDWHLTINCMNGPCRPCITAAIEAAQKDSIEEAALVVNDDSDYIDDLPEIAERIRRLKEKV